MLRKVIIENYALIDSLEIDFSEGLNIITGETGAGKSLLLGALSVILGGRTDAGILRDKEKPCVIETEFGIAGFGLEETFSGIDLDYADTTTLRRVISPSGKSRAYINELPVTVQTLKEIGSRLIDIHSQHQTLLLSNNRFQIDLVDSVAAHGALMDEYVAAYETMKQTARQLQQLREETDNSRKDEDYLRFQYQQLEEARLSEGEQQELESLQNELAHAGEIKETMLASESLLNEDENGVLPRLKAIVQQLNRTENVFPKSAELAGRIRSTLEELKDVSGEISSEGERVETDPTRLESVETRLDMLYSLQQKHRVSSVEELIALRDEIAEKLSGIENFDTEIQRLTTQVAALKKQALEIACKISSGRKSAIPNVEKYVRNTAASLGMPNVQFTVELTPVEELLPNGTDKVRFLFTANRNMPLQPVEQIASGGEMSRLMLCLKSLVAQHKKLPAIIFDEIDTGISGEIADKMGQIIHALASHLQVINITHLPQVASKGQNHYFVYKEDTATATNTRIRKLNDKERVMEIAKMLSGSNVTDAAVAQAQALLRG